MAKIAIIGSKGIPARYGGFETLAENLVKQLSKNHEFIVYCSGPAYRTRRETYLGAKLRYLPLDANGWQSIPYDIWSMIDASRKADLLLVLGVSGCIFLPLLKLFSRKTVLVNLDGLDWNRPKWGRLARKFLKLSEAIAARFADALVADNAAIRDYIRKEYDKDSFLVEYGGDNAVCDLPRHSDGEISIVALQKSGATAPEPIETGFDRYAIAVCRIEPENNIHVILQAFANVNALPVVIVGDWEANEYASNLRRKFGGHDRILLLDPIYDQERLFSLRSGACLYLHGHSAGGTNPSLVESMCLGLPVAAFDVVFNRATTFEDALYFNDEASLSEILDNLETVGLAENGVRMLTLGRNRYTWAMIADKYSDMFRQTLGERASAEPSHESPDVIARKPSIQRDVDHDVSLTPRADAEPASKASRAG